MGRLLDCSPSAVSLDGQVVPVHLDAEETALSPVSSPTVAAHPEFNAVFLAPSHHSDLVVDLGEQFGLGENASSVGVELESGVNTAGNGSSGEDLGLHVVSASH